jgi:hypothetical protein
MTSLAVLPTATRLKRNKFSTRYPQGGEGGVGGGCIANKKRIKWRSAEAVMSDAPQSDRFALPLRRSQQLLRVGRAAVAPGVSRASGGRRPHRGRYHLLHRGQLRGQGARHQDRDTGRRGQAHLPPDRAGHGRTRRLRGLFPSKIALAVERCCPVSPHSVHRRDGLRADGPRAGASARPPDRPRHQAGHQATTSANRCAAPSAWPPTAIWPRSPATCRSQTG